MSSGTHVKVSGTESWFEQSITARQHKLPADEPLEFGGTDQGPTPYELFLGALGSCIAITVRMYAKRKDWPLSDVQVELTHRKTHARDCEDCESTSGYVDVIEKHVEVSGDLTEEQIARLKEIAGKCPVHRTLEGEIKILSKD